MYQKLHYEARRESYTDLMQLITPPPMGAAVGIAMVNTSRHSVKAAAALMEEALEILDKCEALVPAMHLWTALQALGAAEAGFPPSMAGMHPAGCACDSHSTA